MDLDCGKSFGQTVPVICVRRPFDPDGLEVMGQVKGRVGRDVCDGSLAKLRGIYPARATYSEQGGNLYGGRIQLSHSTLFSKI